MKQHRPRFGAILDGTGTVETLGVDFAPSGQPHRGRGYQGSGGWRGLAKQYRKGLVRWNCIDTGVFLLTKNFIRAIGELIPEKGIYVEISEVTRFMLRRGRPFLTRDMTGSFWADIDTEEDLGLVRV